MSERAVLAVRQSELLFIRIGTVLVAGRFDSKLLLVQCKQAPTTTVMTTTTTPAVVATTTTATTSDDTSTTMTSDTTTSMPDEIATIVGFELLHFALIVGAAVVCCFAIIGVAVWRFRSSNNKQEANNTPGTTTADTELNTTPPSTTNNRYAELELKPRNDDDGYEAFPVDRDPIDDKARKTIDDKAHVSRKASSRRKARRSKSKTKIKTNDDAKLHHYSDFDSMTRTTNYDGVFISDDDLKRQSAIAMAPLSSSYSDSESDCKSFVCCVVKLDFNFLCIAGNVNDGYCLFYHKWDNSQ
jgi:hypothetical protein